MDHHVYHPYPPSYGAPDDAILLARLRAQIEFYFSPHNLARDTFLSSLLERNNNAVPVETIANFPKVRELHAIGRLGMMNVPQSAMPPADPFLLCRALEGSLVVTVSNNGQWIHLIKDSSNTVHGNSMPNQESFRDTKSPSSSPSSPSTTASSAGVPTHPIQVKERTTIIVSNVPDGCAMEEMMEMFSTNAFQPKAASHDVDTNTWYITFYSETEAMAALSATRNETIQGMPIHARLQNEGVVMPAPPPRSVSAPVHVPRQYAYPVVMQGYPVYDPYYGVPVMPQQHYGGGGYGMPVHYNNNVMYAQPMPQHGGEFPVHAQHPPHHVQATFVAVPVQQGPPPDEYMPINTGYVVSPQPDMRPQPQQQQYRKRNNSKNRARGRGGNSNRDGRNRQNNYDQGTRQNNYDQGTRQNNYGRDHRQNGYDREQNGTLTNEDAFNDNKDASQNRDTDSTFTSNDGKKKNAESSKNKEKNAVLDQDHFPALVENAAIGGKQLAPTAGYAAALKKQPTNKGPAGESTQSKQIPRGESTSQLEQDMTKLSVSNTAETEPEFWEVDETSMPEMW